MVLFRVFDAIDTMHTLQSVDCNLERSDSAPALSSLRTMRSLPGAGADGLPNQASFRDEGEAEQYVAAAEGAVSRALNAPTPL